MDHSAALQRSLPNSNQHLWGWCGLNHCFHRSVLVPDDSNSQHPFIRAQYTYYQLWNYPTKRLWNQESMGWQGSLGWVLRERPEKQVSHRGRLPSPAGHTGRVLTASQKDGKVLNAGVFHKEWVRQLILPIQHTSNIKGVSYHLHVLAVPSAYEYPMLLTEME